MAARFSAIVLCCCASLVAFHSTALAQEASKFTGNWKGRFGSYDEYWSVKENAGVWSINGKLRVNGQEVGSFIGVGITQSDGKLTFTRKFVKNPNPVTLNNEINVVAHPEGENLSYAWTSINKKGTGALEKLKGDDPAVGGEKVAEDPLGKLRGAWIADVATGFRVVMQVTMKNDKVEVSANYINKKGQFAGSFVGADIATPKEGVLTFTQRFVQKPVSTWGDGKFHTLELVNDNQLRFSWKNGGTENFMRLKK